MLLKVLYFKEPKANLGFSGVTEVAYNLSRALSKKVEITYFPESALNTGYAISLLEIYRRVMIKDFEVIHFNLPPNRSEGGYLLFKLAQISNASTILNIHGIIQFEGSMYGYKKNTINRWLLRIVRSCRLADKLVTYSEFMRNRIVTWYRVDPDKIAVIPNGVDIDKFSEYKNDVLLDGDPAILYLGHLSKDVDILVQAVSKIRLELPGLKLHLVGGGDIDALERLASEKKVRTNVVFHGSVATEKTPSYYKAADFCIFPSRIDSAAITLLEAMASGTAVIASNRGGTSGIISNGKDGILFEPSNANSLPVAILALHQDRKLRKKISQNALETVKEYSWENIAQKYISLYQSLR